MGENMMLVTVCYGKDMVKFNKSTFGVQTKITSFFEDKDDRSLIPASMLEQNNIGYYVEIECKETGIRIFNVAVDLYNNVQEFSLNHKAIYENICEFLKDHAGVNSLFLDMDFNVFCFKVDTKYIPYKLAGRKLIPLTLPNVRQMVGELKDKKKEYIILTFGDTLKIVDTWNSYHLVYLLTKPFIETKFPVIDKKKLEKVSIISFDAFFLTVIYISHIVGAKVQYKETIRRGYDSLSGMNLLAHVPQESWVIEENYKTLKTDRLQSVIKRDKKNIVEKIKDKVLNKTVEDLGDTEDIDEFVPTYFSHVFNERSIVMGWKEFVEMYTGNEFDYNTVAAVNGIPEDAESIIITPDTDIGNQDFHIAQDDILFIGLCAQILYFALKSNTGKQLCTTEETLLAQKLDDYVLSNFYLETDVQFDAGDTVADNPNQPILLDAGG